MKAKKTPARPGNQRLSTSRQRKQQQLLDVRVRSRRATHHRNRRVLVLLAKVALAVASCAGLYYGVRGGLDRFFFENNDYRLSIISVQTDGTLPRAQVLKEAGLAEGINIFSINLARVHDRLQRLAQIEEVQVERRMPNEIDIHVTERKPVAWITTEKKIMDPFKSDVAFLVDARGVVMKEKEFATDYLALPLITSVPTAALVPGKPVDSFEAKTALALLRLTTTSFMQTRFQIRDVDVGKGYCLDVTDKNHTEVLFGFDDLEKQMQRLEQLLVYADDAHRQIGTVNLLVAHNIPVTFTKPAREIISELQDDGEEPEAAPETKTEPSAKVPAATKIAHKAPPTIAAKPEVRRATAAQKPIPRATLVSPGVEQFHTRPTPSPARKAIPLQRFNQGNDGNG
ncbi:MAG: FtsQ-type POTRA domain-containing protein [Chthoniobacterales bacterium]|nr:FtsQ-type POTRA domain-containing protein [Chthoniobacterales bacterium]